MKIHPAAFDSDLQAGWTKASLSLLCVSQTVCEAIGVAVETSQFKWSDVLKIC